MVQLEQALESLFPQQPSELVTDDNVLLFLCRRSIQFIRRNRADNFDEVFYAVKKS